jgi:hypothetical protein
MNGTPISPLGPVTATVRVESLIGGTLSARAAQGLASPNPSRHG